MSRLLLSFGLRVASPKQIFQPVWETGSLITAVSVGREYGLGAGMGLRTGTHACTHAHAPHKAHAHAHTPHTGTHASTHIQTHTQSPHTGFQLPDSTTESADFGISGSHAFSSLLRLWEEPAVRGTEGGGRGCGWGPSHLISTPCSEQKSLLRSSSAPLSGEAGGQFASKPGYLKVEQMLSQGMGEESRVT